MNACRKPKNVLPLGTQHNPIRTNYTLIIGEMFRKISRTKIVLVSHDPQSNKKTEQTVLVDEAPNSFDASHQHFHNNKASSPLICFRVKPRGSQSFGQISPAGCQPEANPLVEEQHSD